MKTLTKTVTINVTQEDIDNGDVSSALTCPVALALSRQLPEYLCVALFSYAQVAPTRFTDEGWLSTTIYEYSRPLAKFIRAFDAEKPVQPGRFRLTKGLEGGLLRD